MRKSAIPVLIIFVSLIIALSCEKSRSFSVNCNECYTVRPDSADLIIYVTINSENPWVPLKLYRGDVEENQVDWIDTVYSKEYKLFSAVSQDYSVSVTYHDGTRKIIAVDGGKMVTSLVTDVCDADCWIIKGGILDVRLKDR